MGKSREGKKMGHDCTRARKILKLFGHSYRRREMRRMERKNTPLYRKVLEVVNIFVPKISHFTPVWRIFTLERGGGGRKATPLIEHENIRVSQEKSISPVIIRKLSRLSPRVDDRTKLYHLVQNGQLKCLKKKRVYQQDKTINSCILLDHGTEFGQFTRDRDGLKRMSQKLGIFINYSGNFRGRTTFTKKERVKYITEKIETFSRDLAKLIKKEGISSPPKESERRNKERSERTEKKCVKIEIEESTQENMEMEVEIEKEKVEEKLQEISTKEAAALLESLKSV